MLVGLGAISVVGCGREGAAVSPRAAAPTPSPTAGAGLAAAAPTTGSAPTSSPATVAPGVRRGPRAGRLAFGAAGLAQLGDGGLRLLSPDGALLSEQPLEQGYGLTALPDGALVAIGQREDRPYALLVGADGAVSAHKVFVLTGESPIAALPLPGDPSAFWLLDQDRCTARLTRRVEQWGELDSPSAVTLDNPNREDVAALADALVFHHLDEFRVVRLKGGERRVPWTPPSGVARLSPGSAPGIVWALCYGGQLCRVDLQRGAVQVQLQVAETAVELAGDGAGLAALSAQRPVNEAAGWTITALDASGQARFTATEAGAQPVSVALSADRVAAGDGARLWIWRRADGQRLLGA